MTKTNPEVEIAKLRGEMNTLSSQIDGKMNILSTQISDVSSDLSGSMQDIKLQLEKQLVLFDKFVTKDDFNRHLQEVGERDKAIAPVIEWGRNRIVIERFFVALISFLGISQTITIIILIIKVLSIT